MGKRMVTGRLRWVIAVVAAVFLAASATAGLAQDYPVGEPEGPTQVLPTVIERPAPEPAPARAPEPAPEVAPAAEERLPTTGADVTDWLVLAGLAIAAGAVAIVAGQRRSRVSRTEE